MNFDLNPQEKELLVALLHRYISETLVEIRHTHHRDFRVALEKDEEMVEGMLDRLEKTIQ
ncbi:MAG: hypothetical protein EPN93_05845 [Spirochaetes bacterium]|nr:MAG: hypothetical protein EPN93_05845 [Spirochaetota bacterium]